MLGVPDPVWGTMIIAVSDSPGSLEDLQAVVRESLPAYAVPRELICLDQLPWLASGKPDRVAIRSMIMDARRRAAGDRVTAETAPRPTPTQWLAGARPRTLPAACSPVIAGTGPGRLRAGRLLGRGDLGAGRQSGATGRRQLRQ